MKVPSMTCLLILTLLASITICFASTGFAYSTIQSAPVSLSYAQQPLNFGYQTVFSYPQGIFTQTQLLPQGPFVQTPIYPQYPGVIGGGVPQIPSYPQNPPQYPTYPQNPPQSPPQSPPQYPSYPQSPAPPQGPTYPPQNPVLPPQQNPFYPPQSPQAPPGGSEADDLAGGQPPVSSQGGDEDTVSIEAAQ